MITPDKKREELSRRAVLFGTASLFALIKVAPVAAQSRGLLDPSQMGASQSGGSALPTVRGASPGDGGARSWFVMTADAIEGLFRKVQASGPEHENLLHNERNLRDRVNRAVRDKEAKLDEFRNGMFCSGCNQTRSEILAKGETFPHSGQSIIRATPAQIAAKEQGLNSAIDRLRAELNAGTERVQRSKDSLAEACDQIQAGCGLFSTALYNWKSKIVSHERDVSAKFIRERDAAFASAASVVERGEKSTSVQGVRSALSDLAMWEDIVRKLNASFASDWSASETALVQLHSVARTRYDRLMAEGNRITHALGVTEWASTFTGAYYYLLKGAGPEISPGRFGGEGFEGLRFRLGDATPSRRGEILANVRTFVDSYRSAPLELSFRFARLPDFDPDPFRHERRRLEIRESELS